MSENDRYLKTADHTQEEWSWLSFSSSGASELQPFDIAESLRCDDTVRLTVKGDFDDESVIFDLLSPISVPDAQLIAAAPDLLKAVNSLLRAEAIMRESVANNDERAFDEGRETMAAALKQAQAAASKARSGDAASGESEAYLWYTNEEAAKVRAQWSCRWKVRGHERRVVSKTTGKIRVVMVRPHSKGPQDKPMKPGSIQ